MKDYMSTFPWTRSISRTPFEGRHQLSSKIVDDKMLAKFLHRATYLAK